MFVLKIIKGSIYWVDSEIKLSKDKIKRYTKRLDEMSVKYKVENDTITLL